MNKVFTPPKPRDDYGKGDLSNNRIRAHSSPLALPALASSPHLIELLDGGGHDGGLVGEDAQ